jgi:aryl-alcohol dehydrogenase-like predicted oxidoreductase
MPASGERLLPAASQCPSNGLKFNREGNQRKLEVPATLATLAEEAGTSLVHLALVFVIKHHAVPSAIIGPRTTDQLESQLGAAEVKLSDDVLDRIDKIVTPGRLSA